MGNRKTKYILPNYFVQDCLQLAKKRQVYLTELTTILCSIIQFFCKNKLKLFRICRKFDFYTYGNDFRGGGGLPLYLRLFHYPRSLINKIYVYMHYPPKFSSTHLYLTIYLLARGGGGGGGVCAIV